MEEGDGQEAESQNVQFQFKKELVLEAYLTENYNVAGRRLLTSIRTGTNPLRIETGRHLVPKLEADRRKCWWCANEVEDEKHFVLYCEHYEVERRNLFQSLSDIYGIGLNPSNLVQQNPDSLFNLIVGEGASSGPVEARKIIYIFLQKAMNKRKVFLQRAWGKERARGYI